MLCRTETMLPPQNYIPRGGRPMIAPKAPAAAPSTPAAATPVAKQPSATPRNSTPAATPAPAPMTATEATGDLETHQFVRASVPYPLAQPPDVLHELPDALEGPCAELWSRPLAAVRGGEGCHSGVARFNEQALPCQSCLGFQGLKIYIYGRSWAPVHPCSLSPAPKAPNCLQASAEAEAVVVQGSATPAAHEVSFHAPPKEDDGFEARLLRCFKPHDRK